MPRNAVPVPAHTPFEAVIDWFRRQRRLRDFDALGADEMRHLASDLRVSVEDLRSAAVQSVDEIALMRRMLALHGLDAAQIERTMPDLMRDMALTCAHCSEKGQCAHKLDRGLAPAEADMFCPNAETMAALARR